MNRIKYLFKKETKEKQTNRIQFLSPAGRSSWPVVHLEQLDLVQVVLFPRPEVHPGYRLGRARETRVPCGVVSEWPALDGPQLGDVVTEDARQAGFVEFRKLFWKVGGGNMSGRIGEAPDGGRGRRDVFLMYSVLWWARKK